MADVTSSNGFQTAGPADDQDIDAPRSIVEDLGALRVSFSEGSRLPEDGPVTVAGGPGGSDGGRDPVGVLGAQPPALVDGLPASVRLERVDAARAVLVEGDGLEAWRTRLVFGPPATGTDGRERREVVVDGWRFEVEIEQEARARLRDRAGRVTAGAGRSSGRVEIRAMIPGKVVAIDVQVGDKVEAGQRLVVLEAMKMQNEIHAVRQATVEKVAVEAGQTVELGDVLIVMT